MPKGVMDILVPDEAYNATGWDGDLSVPTKNAVRDKIESLPVAPATYTSRSEMAGFTPTNNTFANLVEAGREGVFVFSTANLSAAVTSDPQQGIYVAPTSANTGASGAWVRQWDTINGKPEWFGAVLNTVGSAATNVTALQACIDFCPVTLLAGGIYYINARIHIMKNARRIIGAGFTQTDQNTNDANATKIVTTSATADIIQIGSDSGTRPADLVEAVYMTGFTVDRTVSPFTPVSGILGAIGISCRWLVNCHFDRVFSLNSSRAWYIYGCVSCFYTYCSALTDFEGSNPANDTWIGYHFDGSAPSGYNGGNASIFMQWCRAFPITEDGAPSHTYSAGIRFDDGWVDILIKGLEVGANIQYGIHGIGDGYSSTSLKTENLQITDCVLDPSTIANIRLEAGGVHTAVTILNSYFGTGGTASSVALYQLKGAVTVSNNQFLAGGGSTGISAVEVSGLRSRGNIMANFEQPIFLQQCSNFEIADTIKSQTSWTYAAVNLLSCNKGIIAPAVFGIANAYAKGVSFNNGASSEVVVDGTLMSEAAILGGWQNKIYHNGTQITVPGAFGDDSIAVGILNPAAGAAGFYAPAAGSLTDGDRGDVLLSSSATVWTVQGAATGFRVGDLTSGGSASPDHIHMGSKFSNAAGANPKIFVYNDGTFIYGVGVSDGQFDYIAPSGAAHAFYITGTGRLTLLTAAAYTISTKLVTLASAAGASGLNIPHGTAPTTPNNGDFWTTTAGLFGRINGVTIAFNAVATITTDGLMSAADKVKLDGNLTPVHMTADAAARGPGTADYFASTISLEANSTYDIECHVHFLKSTAGTITWTWLFSSAPAMVSSRNESTPVTGYTAAAVTGAPVPAQATGKAQTTINHAASASLTSAVDHSFVFWVRLRTVAATTIQLRSAESAGTITPRAGSYMRAIKIL